MADNTTKVDVGGNSSSKSHIEVPNNLKQLKKLGIRKLRSLCGQLQLEKEGTKTVLLDRIAAHLKIKPFINGNFHLMKVNVIHLNFFCLVKLDSY